MNPPFPRIPFLRGWADAKTTLNDEFQQSLEEGRDPGAIERFRAQAAALDDAAHAELTDNNNAALVVASLLLGGDDFEKVITLAVMGGWDTDCNGATAGSIWGAMFGTARLPKKWIAPLHDTLYSLIPDYHPIAISECARRSAQIALKINPSLA